MVPTARRHSRARHHVPAHHETAGEKAASAASSMSQLAASAAFGCSGCWQRCVSRFSLFLSLLNFLPYVPPPLPLSFSLCFHLTTLLFCTRLISCTPPPSFPHFPSPSRLPSLCLVSSCSALPSLSLFLPLAYLHEAATYAYIRAEMERRGLA